MKRRFNILLLLFVTTAFSGLFAADFGLANQHYAAGDYDAAIAEYEALLQSGNESADLYYNLGNAYFRKGALADCILNYERALKLSPYDADIQHNLEFARMQTVDKIEPAGEMLVSKWWRDCRNAASSDTWAYIACGLFSLMLLLLAAYIFSGKMWLRKTGFSIAVVSLLFFVLTTVFAAQQKAFVQGGNEAIIFSPTVTVKSTPDNSGTDLFILHEGTKVKTGNSVGSWVEITMQDGNTGWLPSQSVRVI